jgi:small nuclear ribonucleoprotein F
MNLQVGQFGVAGFAMCKSCTWKLTIYHYVSTRWYGFNMQLASTEEYIDGQFTGNLGEVLIR